MAPVPDRPSARSGTDVPRLGRYRVCYRIAQGGMASVYLARLDTTVGFSKWVALKIIHPNIATDERFLAMFLDEARLAAQLDHTNLCTVFDFGDEDGTFYIAMEYLHGETLGAVARRAWGAQGSLPLELGVRVVADAARGLHAAHEMRDVDGSPANVVHRDVSPENLFVTYTGTSKTVDFGVARSSVQEHERTATGELKGKLAYMSPEQLHERNVDRRTDVWALGVVLWEVTVGRRLFRRQTDAQTVFAITRDPITRPSRLREGYPPELEAIVLRALERDKEKRYATALDLTRALEAWLNSTGHATGVSEVGEFMQALFADQIAWRDRYLRKGDAPFEDLIAQWQSAPRNSTIEVADANTVAMGIGIPGPDASDDPTRLRAAPRASAVDDDDELRDQPTRAMAPRAAEDAAHVIPLTRRATASHDIGTALPPIGAPLRLLHTPQFTPPPIQRDLLPAPLPVPPRRSRWADYATLVGLFAMGGVMVHIWYDNPQPRPLARPPARVVPAHAPRAPVARPRPAHDADAARPVPVVQAPPVVRAPPVVQAPPVVRAPPVVVPPRVVAPRPAGGVDDGSRRVEGFLTLSASAPADVYVGERRLGRAPLRGVAMSPGVYALRVVPVGGGAEREVRVTVRAGETVSADVSADALP